MGSKTVETPLVDCNCWFSARHGAWRTSLFILLIGPAIFLFILWGVLFASDQERKRWSQVLRFIGGGIVGLLVFYLLFGLYRYAPYTYQYFHNGYCSIPQSWGLQASDLDRNQSVFGSVFLVTNGETA